MMSMARHSASYDIRPDGQQELSKSARACWTLLPIACGLFSLLAFKLLFLYLQFIPFPLIWALMIMRKRPGTVSGQAAESFLIGFLLLFGLYLISVCAALLWEAFFINR